MSGQPEGHTQPVPPGSHAADAAPNVTAAVGQLLEGLAERARNDRRGGDTYQDLAQATSLTQLLRKADHLMMLVVLDLTQVLEERHGIAVDKDTYQLLLALPGQRRELEEHFRSTEGHGGCVDKAFAALAGRVTAGNRNADHGQEPRPAP